MWFQPKNIHFGSVVHKLCPKTPKFCWFGAKMGLSHNFTRNDILSYVRTFYGLTTSKQCDLHLQTSFLGACLMFIGQFGYGPGSGPAHANVCPSFEVEIFHVLEFSQTNCLYRLTEKSIENLAKLWFEFHIAFGYLAGFHQTFFFTFSNLKCFGNFQKWPCMDPRQ